MIAKTCLLLAVLASVSLATDTCGPSDINGILTCYSAYLNFYGLSPMNGSLPQYQVFNKTRNAKFHSNTASIAPVCYTQGTLQNCLKAFPCLAKDTYLTLGESGDDAFKYWADLAEWDFVCGPGYNTLTTEYNCLVAVVKNYGAKITQCSTDMNNSINKGGNVCDAFNTYLTCLTSLFTTYCDKNAGAYECGANRAGLNAYYPACDQQGKLNSCPPFTKMNAAEVMARDLAFKNWH